MCVHLLLLHLRLRMHGLYLLYLRLRVVHGCVLVRFLALCRPIDPARPSRAGASRTSLCLLPSTSATHLR